MLVNGGNDGNMDLGISRVPERVETAGPRGNDTGYGQQDESSKSDDEDEKDERAKERLKLLARKLRANPLDTANQLEKAKDT